jgi:hypothetical protein
VIVVRGLLGDVGQHRIGAAESDHGHLAEEDRDLAEDVRDAEAKDNRADGNEPKGEQVSLWILYGILNGDWVIVIANSFGCTLIVILLAFKFRDMR